MNLKITCVDINKLNSRQPRFLKVDFCTGRKQATSTSAGALISRPLPLWLTQVGGASVSKGTGAFSCGFAVRSVAANAWSRSRRWQLSASPPPTTPVRGPSAQRGGAAGEKGSYHPSHLHAWVVSVCGWLCIGAVASSVLLSSLCRSWKEGGMESDRWRGMGGGGGGVISTSFLSKQSEIMTLQFVRCPEKKWG